MSVASIFVLVASALLSGLALEVPIIDITPLHKGSFEDRLAVAKQIGKACEEMGFIVLTGHGVNQDTISRTWKSTKDFFDLDEQYKLQYEANQEEYPFGYSRVGGEVLSAGKSAELGIEDVSPPDLKEMFSLGPSDPLAGFPPRIFPKVPESFEKDWADYYEEMSSLAAKVLSSFALALNLPEDFFKNYTSHHASALRGLNYPKLEQTNFLPNQMRASAHTDYGMITILRVDGPGLQVSKDVENPNWQDVPFVENAYIINLGDLMKRWTNDHWASTLHRVIVPNDQCSIDEEEWQSCRKLLDRRQSIAFFHNLNQDAIVSNLFDETAKYEPVVAGEFLMQKHLASIGKY